MNDSGNPKSELQRELFELIDACWRGEASEAEESRLRDLVRGNADARRWYVQYMYDSISLRRRGTLDESIPTLPLPEAKYPSPPSPVSVSGLRSLWNDFAREPVALAVLLLVMLFGGALMWKLSTLPRGELAQGEPRASENGEPRASARGGSVARGDVSNSPVDSERKGTVQAPPGADAPGSPKAGTPGSPSSSVIARLKQSANSKWDGTAWQPGAELHAGQRLVLKQGLAQIAYASGAMVILEGPAELVVGAKGSGIRGQGPGVRNQGSEGGGDNACSLASGKLVAQVPPSAHGFTVDTPRLTIVDLGTEFAVSVELPAQSEIRNLKSEIPSTEVHVLRGEVQIISEQAAGAEVPQSKIGAPAAAGHPKSKILRAGEAVVSDADAAAPRVIKAEPARFVRKLSADEPGASPGATGLTPGDILAVSRHTLKLVKIDPQTGEQTLLAQGNRDQHGTDWMCVAVDGGGRAIVGTDGPVPGSRVLRIDPRGGKIDVLAAGGLLEQGRVSGLAIGPDGAIYATHDGVDDKILKIDPQSRAVAEVAGFGSNAWGVAVDVNGRDLFATSDGTGTVALIRGGKIAPWVFGNKTQGVRGVAVRPDGRVFVSVTKEAACKIVEVDRTTHAVTDIASLPPQPSVVLGMMAVEADGHLIVAHSGLNGKVYRVDVDARTMTPLSAGKHLEEVFGVAVVAQFPVPSP